MAAETDSSSLANRDDDVDTIVSEFDRLCFSFGDEDAILHSAAYNDEEPAAVSYFEIQEYSKNLALQLHWRLQPDYVLVDCQRFVCAEAVATLACMRINCPFVPVSCTDQHRPGRLNVLVDHLRAHGKSRGDSKEDAPVIVAITVCESDQDPILAVFQQANVHQILYLDMNGGLRVQIQVPSYLPAPPLGYSDELMILFTSGTTGGSPKAVVGSHGATLRRIRWFHGTFESSPRIIRKTALTFVDGITELWCTLLDRHSVLVSLLPELLLGEGLAAILRAEPTQLLLLPSQLGQLLLLPKCESLKRLIISGEQASRLSVERVCEKYDGIELINLYGQTETSGDVLCAVLTKMEESTAFHDDVVAVGTPIADTSIGLNNQQEIIIRGSLLSLGYLGQKIPFDSFATGDIGFLKDGVYYVKARKDDVLKINGIWTCPLEIESAFCRFYQTREALACFVADEAYIFCPDFVACDQFSREEMFHEGKLPWNLIPKAVFCHTIPTSYDSGSGKASRKEAQKIVKQCLESSKPPRTPEASAAVDTISPPSTSAPSLLGLLCQALGLNEAEIDLNKSFVDLGGNSARAITLLYHMRQSFPAAAQLTAVDLLTTESLRDLEIALSAEGEQPVRKRPKKPASSPTDIPFFIPQTVTRHSENHVSLGLLACIDSKPTLHDDSMYVACQGGVVVKCRRSGDVEAHRHLRGWMIQADLVVARDLLIVCASKRENDAGLVVALSLDLKEELWKVEYDLPIKASPLVVDDCELWVSVGTTEQTNVCRISLVAGCTSGERLMLPFPSLSKPVLVDRNKLIYGCSSWEGGIFVIRRDSEKVEHLFESEIGPIIGRDLVLLPSGGVLMADAYGGLHTLDTNKMFLSTVRLGSMPLTTPLCREDGSIIVGSNNGKLYAIMGTTILWEYDCGVCILGKPFLNRKDGCILVRTIAGHLLFVNRDGGAIRWKRRLIIGEIWGDAEDLFPLSTSSSELGCMAFGARDARVHIISF